MGVKVSNNAYGTLAANITSAATTITLNAGQGARFPALTASDWAWATLSNAADVKEIVKITARSGDTFTVVRGQDGTTASAYLTGDRLDMRPTAAVMNDKLDVTDAANTYQTSAQINTTLSAYAKLSGGNDFSGVQKIPAQHATVVALGNLSGVENINLALGSTFTGTVIGTTTFTFSNAPAAGKDQTVYLKLTNAGAYTIGWPAGTKFPNGGAAPVLTAAGKDLLGIWYDVEQNAYVVGVMWKDYK